MNIVTNPKVKDVFDSYPKKVRSRLQELRKLILESAGEVEGIQEIEETLKWGEPSYLVNKGSTIRIDWKDRTPDQYAMYFKCTSKLIPTFKKVYKDYFTFEGDRAIVFKFDGSIPEEELKNCIKAGLQYHLVKKLPNLGM